ncbi:MAG: iron ABC transporter permease [Chlamydiae bacterium]|nr:iron ABC transporter permease [Chlamydiota bacterium]MBI3276359.1 iron ABC transporter permease [Chlamydiota bacterium]
MKSKQLTLLMAVLFFICVGVVPIFWMFLQSFISKGHFSFENYVLILGTRRSWLLLFNSLALSLLTASLSLVLGVALGIVLTKTDLPLKNVFTLFFASALIIPPYFFSLGWIYLLGKNAGLLSGFWGSLWIMVSTLTPLVLLMTKVYLHSVNPKLEEAARLQAGWSLVLRKISLPLIKRGIILAAILVFILTLGELGVPMLFRFNVFSVESFSRFSAFYDFNAATASAIPLSLIALFMMMIERSFFRKESYDSPRLISERQILMIPLKQYRLPWVLGVVLLLSFFVVLPLGSLMLKSLHLKTFMDTFSRAQDSLWRSILLAGLTSTVLTALGFFLGYLVQRKIFRFAFWVDSLTIFLFALPGTAIGIGLISLWNRPFTNFIYSSVLILLFGTIAQYAALASRLMVPTFSRIPVTMEEAAEMTGASWFRRVFKILIPLASKGMFATWLILFIFCLKDVGVGMMIHPPGYDTLPIRIFTLMSNSSEATISAMCMMLWGITWIPFLALTFFFGRRFS